MSYALILLLLIVTALVHEFWLPSGTMVTEQRSWRAFVDRLSRNWLGIALFLIAYLMIAGDLLLSFGIAHLFRDDGDSFGFSVGLLLSPPLWSGAALALMLTIVFATAFVFETGDQQLFGASLNHLELRAHLLYIIHHALPLGLLVVLAYLLFEGDVNVLLETALAALGLFGGFVAGLLGVWALYVLPTPIWFQQAIARVRKHFRYQGLVDLEIDLALIDLLLLQLVILLLVTITQTLLTSLAILMLLGWLFLIVGILRLVRAAAQLQIAMFGLILVIVVNGMPRKHTFDELDDLYDNPIPGSAALVEPIQSFDSWRNALPTKGFVDNKPPVVILALSGGAYRAGFWSALVIDKLLAESRTPGSELEGLAEHVKIVSGASGGMVAGAYFVAGRSPISGQSPYVLASMLNDIEFARANDPDYATLQPINRDSLSPVAQHLVQRDLFKLFVPGLHLVMTTDRGEVLDRQWGSLRVPFHSLRGGEAEGWRPSLLLSPMLAQSAQQLLITNLIMPATVPGTHIGLADPVSFNRLSVATTVRLNATFPYVTPAVFLPPPIAEQPLDAGFYDNFGMQTVTGLLRDEQIMNWVVNNTSGVIVVRVDGTQTSGGSSGFLSDWLARAADSLGWPFEALIAARRTPVLNRDAAAVAQLNQTFDAVAACATPAACPDPWISVIRIENLSSAADVSLSWYVTKRGMESMQAQLGTPRVTDTFGELADDYQRRLALP